MGHVDLQTKVYIKKYSTTLNDSAKVLKVFVNIIQLGNVLNLRFTNQRFGSRRSRFDDTFKGNGEPVVSTLNDVRSQLLAHNAAHLNRIYLRHCSTGKLRFELESISLAVNWWFDVVYREKTGCD